MSITRRRFLALSGFCISSLAAGCEKSPLTPADILNQRYGFELNDLEINPSTGMATMEDMTFTSMVDEKTKAQILTSLISCLEVYPSSIIPKLSGIRLFIAKDISRTVPIADFSNNDYSGAFLKPNKLILASADAYTIHHEIFHIIYARSFPLESSQGQESQNWENLYDCACDPYKSSRGFANDHIIFPNKYGRSNFIEDQAVIAGILMTPDLWQGIADNIKTVLQSDNSDLRNALIIFLRKVRRIMHIYEQFSSGKMNRLFWIKYLKISRNLQYYIFDYNPVKSAG